MHPHQDTVLSRFVTEPSVFENSTVEDIITVSKWKHKNQDFCNLIAIYGFK